MKTISVEKECTNYETYRAQRVKSLFNAEYGHKFSISVDTDIDEFDWKICCNARMARSRNRNSIPECGLSVAFGWKRTMRKKTSCDFPHISSPACGGSSSLSALGSEKCSSLSESRNEIQPCS